MSWKKYFKPVNSVLPSSMNSGSSTNNNYAGLNRSNNWLPEVYEGPPDRLQRYGIYETMDFDHEVHAALDTIADFSTEVDPATKQPFNINYYSQLSSHEVQILQKTLSQWCILNEFNKRVWNMFRSTLQYGDQFFIRDPETYKLFWCDPNKITKVIVNESKGKDIETYYIRDLDLNLQASVATNQHSNSGMRGAQNNMIFSPAGGNINAQITPVNTGIGDGKFAQAGEYPVAAEHVIQLSLSDGMSAAWPFGVSILEFVYKVYKQKELLEDSILIYRIHRAPERRVFFIDTGTMPPNKAHQYLERIKYEVQQKRVPSRNGGGQSVTDSAYNPLSMLEDYFFAVSSEGRGSKVETLPGGEALGQIDDLRYFNNKMLRALGVPSSYLPTGPEDGTASYNDGRVGTAFIQEFRFSKVCERYQQQIIKPLDLEFKLFLKHKGIEIDNSAFSLEFTKPQSFSEYRRLELDAAKINVFNTMSAVPYISKRFALSRYLGLTEDEIRQNEKMWIEENSDVAEPDAGTGDLGSVGITSSGIDTMAPEEGFDDAEDELGGEEETDTSELDSDVDVPDDTDIDNFGV
jgi:hypothetical protein